MSKDTRFVYGVRCSWFGPIQETVVYPGYPPVCPYCHGVLFEVSNEETWWDAAKKYEEEGNPGYVAMLKWSRGLHFPSFEAMQVAYLKVN